MDGDSLWRLVESLKDNGSCEAVPILDGPTRIAYSAADEAEAFALHFERISLGSATSRVIIN